MVVQLDLKVSAVLFGLVLYDVSGVVICMVQHLNRLQIIWKDINHVAI